MGSHMGHMAWASDFVGASHFQNTFVKHENKYQSNYFNLIILNNLTLG